MIKNDHQLDSSRRELDRLFGAFLEFRSSKQSKPRTYDLMAPSFTGDIASITESIYNYLGIPIVAVPAKSDVSMRLKGNRVELGELSISTVSDCLAKFQSGIRKIAHASKIAQSSDAVLSRKSCKFTLSGVGRGSVNLLMDELESADDAVINSAVETLVEGIEKCSENGELPIAYAATNKVENSVVYEVFRAIAGLMPSDKSVEAIEFTFASRFEQDRPATVTVTSKVAETAKKWASTIASNGVKVSIVGKVRQSDLDTRKIKIVVEEEDHTFKKINAVFSESLIPDVIKCFGKKARVVGILKTIGRASRLEIEHIEISSALFE